MKITLPVKSLLALERLVGHEETRFYLTGICIEPHPVEGILLVATDGHRLGVWHEKNCLVEGEWPTGDKADSIIVDMDKTKVQHMKLSPGRHTQRMVAVIDTEAETITIAQTEYDSMTNAFSPRVVVHDALIKGGKFPAWKKILPKLETLNAGSIAPASGFNAKYLADFGYICEPHSCINLIGTGDPIGPCYVIVNNLPQFVGVLMPMRPESPDKRQEEFNRVLQPKAEGN